MWNISLIFCQILWIFWIISINFDTEFSSQECDVLYDEILTLKFLPWVSIFSIRILLFFSSFSQILETEFFFQKFKCNISHEISTLICASSFRCFLEALCFWWNFDIKFCFQKLDVFDETSTLNFPPRNTMFCMMKFWHWVFISGMRCFVWKFDTEFLFQILMFSWKFLNFLSKSKMFLLRFDTEISLRKLSVFLKIRHWFFLLITWCFSWNINADLWFFISMLFKKILKWVVFPKMRCSYVNSSPSFAPEA